MAQNETNTTSTENQPAMTWYACGQVLPAGILGDKFQSMALDHVRKTAPNLVPTTYEAADAYLQEEFKKPKGERDLLREMCMIIPLGLPKDRKVYIAVPNMKSVFPLHDGSIIVFPTIEIPPDSFGGPEHWHGGFLDSKNQGLVDHNMLVYDPPTSIPQKGTIVMSYLTKSEPDKPLSVDCMRVDAGEHYK